jgi:hypothetical protein
MAYTVAPLKNWEHGADASNLGDAKDNCSVPPASFQVTADHDPVRDGGGPLGRRFCWSGSEMVGDYPELIRHTPMRHNTENVGGGTSGAVQLAG